MWGRTLIGLSCVWRGDTSKPEGGEMKRIAYILVGFALLVGAESTGELLLTSPKLGDTAPEFSLPDVSGRVVSLRDYKGKKNVVLVFYREHG